MGALTSKGGHQQPCVQPTAAILELSTQLEGVQEVLLRLTRPRALLAPQLRLPSQGNHAVVHPSPPWRLLLLPVEVDNKLDASLNSLGRPGTRDLSPQGQET